MPRYFAVREGTALRIDPKAQRLKYTRRGGPEVGAPTPRRRTPAPSTGKNLGRPPSKVKHLFHLAKAKYSDVYWNVLGALGDALGNTLGDTLGKALGNTLGNALGDALRSALGNTLRNILGNNRGNTRVASRARHILTPNGGVSAMKTWHVIHLHQVQGRILADRQVQENSESTWPTAKDSNVSLDALGTPGNALRII